MNRLFYNLIAYSCLFVASASSLLAQHLGDIDVEIQGNKIITNSRVYGVELGELGAGFEYFADEPGYDALPGTFTANTSVGIDILGALKIWNGTSFNTLATPRLLVEFGPTSVLSPTTNTFLTGLSSNSNPAGEWHKHFDMTLVNSAGNPLPAPSPAPAEIGVYMLELQLRTTQSGIESSLPYYLVINNGDTGINHDAAIAYQQAVVAIPEPGTWALIVCGLGTVGFWGGRKLRRQIPAAC